MRWQNFPQIEQFMNIIHRTRRAGPIFAVAIVVISITGTAGFAQEVIDPSTGQLHYEVTDLVVPAGPLTLDVTRVFHSDNTASGVLGSGWRFNWENSLHGSYDEATILEDGSRLSRIEGPHGSFLAFTLDEYGRITRAESSMSSRVEYGYEGDRLVEVRVDGGPPERYRYDEAGALVAIERPSTGHVDLSYDSRNRVTRRRWADGSEETFEYPSAGRLTRLTHVTGGITTFRWSEDGRRQDVTDPLGHSTVTEYDSGFRPISVTDPAGAVTRYRYDALGRVVQIDLPGDRTIDLEYRGDSQLVTAIHRPDGSEESFNYDQHGNLVAEKVNGTVLRSYSYFPDGLIKSIEGIELPEVQFTYLPNGLLHTETDALGQVTRYRYDDRGNLVSRTENAGNTTRWRYDERNRLVSETDATGVTTSYSYDEREIPVAITDPSGGVTRYSHDARGRLVAEVDPLGRTTRHVYRPDGQLSRTVDSAGHAIRYEYDAAGRLVREVGPLGGVTEYSYDALDRVVAISDPAGSTWSYRYSDEGRISELTTPSGFSNSFDPSESRQEFVDPAGRLTIDLYGPLGQLTERRLPGGVDERYRYDDSGQLVEISTNSGLSTTLTYDPLGRPLRLVLPTGLEIRNSYDALGHLVRIEDSLGGAATMAYDPAGRVTRVTEADGATTRYRYDAAGRQIERVDPRGHSTRYAYDPAGQLVAITGPGDETIGFEYDVNGELAAVHLPGGGATFFARDALGNPLRVTDALGQTVVRAFDSAGRLLQEIDPRGNTTTLRYDEAGRLSRTTRPDGVAVVFSYDTFGNLVELNDGAFVVRYGYDDRGNQTRISYPALGRSLSFSYDGHDRLTLFVDPEGRSVGYRYDPFDRLTSVVTPAGDEVSISYDAKDRPTSIRYPNGITESWRYDTADRPLEIVYEDRSKKVLALRRYSYDAAGNPVEVSDGRGRVAQYSYDRSDQLIEESGPWGFRRYSYRADGNRASMTDGEETVEYQYDPAGRLVRAGGESFSYDARGNMVERRGPEGRTSYVFDGEDRLVKAVLPDGESIRFGYAPTGERIWREDAAGRTWFLTDGDHRVADLDEELQVAASYLHGPWLDRPFAASSGGEVRWFLRDALGSIIALCDAASNLTDEYPMDGFGNPLKPAPVPPHPFGFTAREYEPKLDLYYFRARYYDPRLGRFISADPLQTRLTDPLSANRYTYVRNAPTRFTDPMGLRAEQLWSAELPLPPPDESVTSMVRTMSQRYGTPPGRTARLVLEEYRHLQRLSDLQHRVPNPRRLPKIMREKPSLYEAAQRVKDQLELNKLFHRPGVDPRSASSNLEGARRFLQIQRQKETAQAVTSLRNLGSTPPDWAVKPRNTKTVGARAPGADGAPTGMQPAPSTTSGAGSSGGGPPQTPSTNSGAVPAVRGTGAAVATGSGSAGAPRSVTWSRTYKGPPPLSRTRGNWGPLKPKPPTAWQKFAKPPTAGQSFTLTLLLTNERILRCRAQGLTAGQCAEQFLKEMWDAKYEIGLFVTVAIVSPVAGTVVVGALSVLKGVTDVIEVGYSWWDKREAEKNLERILEERKKWTADNLTPENYAVRMLEMEALIRDTGDVLRKACDTLAANVDLLERGVRSAEVELKKKPSADEINAGADACRSLSEKEARLRSIEEEIGGLVDLVKGDVDSAWRLAANCRSKEDVKKLSVLIQANDSKLRKIEEGAAETETIQRQLDWHQDTIETAQKALRRAMDLRDVMIEGANAMPAIASSEEAALRAEVAIDMLTDPPPSLGNDIKNLVKAFGDYDDLSLEVVSDIEDLRQQIRDLWPLAKQCKPADSLRRHREAADRIVRAKLEVQALIDKVDASPLTGCGVGSLRNLAREILESSERAVGLRQFNEEARKEARKCPVKHGLAMTDAGSGSGADASTTSTDSGEKTPPALVQASSGTTGTGGKTQKPPLVGASKPGGPTTGSEPKGPTDTAPQTDVKTQSGDEKLVYANLDIELAQDDYGIYDIIDSDHVKDYEIIVDTPQGDKQYLGVEAVKYLVRNGWLIHRPGVGWIATDRLKRFLGIGESEEPEKPKGSGRPTLGGLTFDAPLEEYNPDDPNTPEGKRKILGELNRQCMASAAWGRFWTCLWDDCMNVFVDRGKEASDKCNDACSDEYEKNKPPVCREAEALAAQLGSQK